ncbi:hypothetical protein UT300009_24890 [Paraclostridium bifermentans]
MSDVQIIFVRKLGGNADRLRPINIGRSFLIQKIKGGDKYDVNRYLKRQRFISLETYNEK